MFLNESACVFIWTKILSVNIYILCKYLMICSDVFTLACTYNKLIIAPDKRYTHDIFLFLHKKICCGYSLEAPRWGASNEYPQHMFLLRNKKNISTFLLKKMHYLEIWDLFKIQYSFSYFMSHNKKIYLRTCVPIINSDQPAQLWTAFAVCL